MINIVLEEAYDKKLERLTQVSQRYDDEKPKGVFSSEISQNFLNIHPTEIVVIRDLQRARKLINLLVGSEIERIVAWTNPQDRRSLRILDENAFGVKVSNWREFVKAAWDISPQLAIMMSLRFPGVHSVKRFLEKKVREHPYAVLEVPEAFPLLVNEQNVRENIKELKVNFFHHHPFHFSHSLLVELLTKSFTQFTSLKCFKHKKICFNPIFCV